MERNETLNQYARQLRREQTREEARMWYQFLSKYPCRFRRQYVIGNYIADFYCHKAKLVVELDGSQHYDAKAKACDGRRTNYMESQGIMVLRFTNLDVQQQFRSVCEVIDRTVKERTNCG